MLIGFFHFVSVGGPYLSEALGGAGFKDILDTDQHQLGKNEVRLLSMLARARASDFFQDWWAKVTHGAKNGGSFSEMMGPSISN